MLLDESVVQGKSLCCLIALKALLLNIVGQAMERSVSSVQPAVVTHPCPSHSHAVLTSCLQGRDREASPEASPAADLTGKTFGFLLQFA